MLDCLTHPLTFPKYSLVKQYENGGNFAVSKYYHFPWRFFYRHKIRMIEKAIRDERFGSIMDFGCGPGLMHDEWLKFSDKVYLIEKYANYIPKVDLAICASVMEFVDLKKTMRLLSMSCDQIVISSPMRNSITETYFNAVGSYHTRNSHEEIISEMLKYFNLTHYESWMGLYFCARGSRR